MTGWSLAPIDLLAHESGGPYVRFDAIVDLVREHGVELDRQPYVEARQAVRPWRTRWSRASDARSRVS